MKNTGWFEVTVCVSGDDLPFSTLQIVASEMSEEMIDKAEDPYTKYKINRLSEEYANKIIHVLKA